MPEKKFVQAQQELADEKARRLHVLAITKTSDMFKKRKVDPKEEAGDKRNTWEWLTPQGSLALGIRKNFSNIASGDLGITLCDDISRWTVVRNEIRVAACMIAGSWMLALMAAKLQLKLNLSQFCLSDRTVQTVEFGTSRNSSPWSLKPHIRLTFRFASPRQAAKALQQLSMMMTFSQIGRG